jgi:glycerol-3-phosphate acyltransferase PlsY
MNSDAVASAVAIVVGGYLLGAVPFGLLVAKRQAGIDLRRFGSGSTGATNVYRAVGWKASTVVIAADVAKAIVPILAARYFTGSAWVESAAGIAAVVGHSWPVYSGWSGGKGAASSLGALMVISTPVGLGSLAVAALVVARTRFVSLGSIAAAAFGALGMSYLILTGSTPFGYVLFTVICPLIIVVRHRDNVRRLLAGRERKLGEKVSNLPKDVHS